MKLYTITLGCRTNQYDTASLEALLSHNGVDIVRNSTDADIIFVQTCSVTGKANSKSGQTIRKLIADNKDKIVLVGGCAVEGNAEFFRAIDGVAEVFGVNCAQKVCLWLADKKLITQMAVSSLREFFPVNDFIGRTRAHLKIQDGCDSFCSYCIVPFLRGKPVSRPLSDIMDQINRLLEVGYREIVLTGIHVGKYQWDGIGLADLIERIVSINGSFRIRLSSIEPQEVDSRLIYLVTSHPKVCNHIHIPLQSGSNAVLSNMNRKYDISQIEKLMADIKNKNPFCGIGTDIIAGFPGESDENFKDGLKNIERLPFSFGHIFPYSIRKGTVAAEMSEKVVKSEITERVKRLKTLFAEKKEHFMRSMVGGVFECIIEQNSKGYASNYAPIAVNDNVKNGEIITFKVTGLSNGFLIGLVNR